MEKVDKNTEGIILSTFARLYIDDCRIYQYGLYEIHVTEKQIFSQQKNVKGIIRPSPKIGLR